MATFSASASELKYASGSSWSSGKARQGVYSGTRYEGAIKYNTLGNLDMSNIEITQISMSVTFGRAGGDSTKYLTFYKANSNTISGSISSMRGASIGALTVTTAYDCTKTLTFNASSNAGMFNMLRQYFMAGNRVLILYVPSTRGTYSGGYCYDYLSVTASTITITYEYLQSDGSLSSDTVEAGSPITLNINAYNSAYSHRCTWKFGTHTATQNVAAGATTASYTIPLSWLDAIPSATSGSASVVLETLDTGGNVLGSATYGFTVTVPGSVVPTMTGITTTPVNSNSVIHGWGIYVYGKSQAQISITGAAGKYGSTIRSYSITTSPSIGSGTSAQLTTGTIYKTGTITVTATITDSRGRTATASKTISVHSYSAPYFSTIEAWRSTSGGEQNETNGTYARIRAVFGCSALSGSNSVTCSLRLVQVGGSYSTSAALTSGTAVVLGDGNLAIDAVYEATLTLTDTVGTVTVYKTEISSVAYVLHVKKGGKAIGFGRAAGADETASFGWKLKLDDPLEVTEGGTGANTAAGACSAIGAVKKSGDTMTGNLTVQGTLYPSVYLKPTQNGTTNCTVLEGSYVGASSFAAWEDSTGNNRRMLEVRTAAYQASLDNAVVLRNVINGSYYTHRVFHEGMATPVPVSNGGTGASSAKAALTNLGIIFAETLPETGTDGQICLIPV